MRVLAFVGCIAGILLGGFWLLQGLALITVKPILCFADCQPLEGPSATWALIGAGLLAASARGIARLRRSRRQAAT